MVVLSPASSVTTTLPLAGTMALNQKSNVVVVKPLQDRLGNVTPAEALVLLVKDGGLINPFTPTGLAQLKLTVKVVAPQGSSDCACKIEAFNPRRRDK